MRKHAITPRDRDLIDAASETLRAHFEPGKHRTACGLRTGSGAVYTAINLVSPTGPAQIHCEPIALGMAVMDGHTDYDTSVAVSYPEEDPTRDPRVVSACGVCRELYWSLAPTIDVIVPGVEEPVKSPLADLLPAKSRSST